MSEINVLHRLPAVMAITGLSRSSIYSFIKQGSFPQAVKIGVRATAWRSTDLAAWSESKSPAA